MEGGRGKEMDLHWGSQPLKLQELVGREQAEVCKSSTLEEERLELPWRKQVGRLVWETDMLWACFRDRPAVAGGEQEGTGGPTPLCAGRRGQPLAWLEPGDGHGHGQTRGRGVPGWLLCHVDAGQSPALAPALARGGPLESLGLREDGQPVLIAEEVASAPCKRWAQVHPRGVDMRAVLEEPVPPASSSAGLSQTEAQELLWGTEGDASPAQPLTVGSGETERRPAILEQAGHLSGGLAPTGSQGQVVEEQGQRGESTLE